MPSNTVKFQETKYYWEEGDAGEVKEPHTLLKQNTV